MRIGPFLLFPLILTVFSCDFEPEGMAFTEVAPPVTSDLSIEIPVNTNDSIFLFKPADLSYRSILGTHEANLVKVFLDGDQLLTSGKPTGLIGFYTPNYPSGIYRLTIELYATGGSGSLADAEGKEEIMIKRDYTLVIDHAAPDQISFTNMQVENGSLKVSWERYKRKNFQRYYLQKYCYNSFTAKYENCWYKRLSDQDVTTLTDSSFIGGKARYRISVLGADQVGPATEKEFEVAYDPQLTWAWLNNEELKLTWFKPPCFSSFTSYTISYGPNDDRQTTTVDGLNDTTWVINPALRVGVFLDVMVSVNPYRTNVYNMDYATSRTFAYHGKKFPSFFRGSVRYNQVLNKYFIVRLKSGYYELIRVNADDYQEEQKLNIFTETISLSDNGAHLYLVEENVLKKVDPLTFTTITTFDLTTLETAWAEWTFNVSDDNLVVASNYGGTYVLDMNDGHVVQELTSELSTIISPNGKYLSRRTEILAFESGQYVSKMSLPESYYSGRQFIANERCLVPARGTLLVVDLNTASIVNTILIEGGYQGYDPVSGMASAINTQYAIDPGVMSLYSLDKKEAVKTIGIAGKVRLMNNSLVSNGLITPLSSYYP